MVPEFRPILKKSDFAILVKVGTHQKLVDGGGCDWQCRSFPAGTGLKTENGMVQQPV
jgi:hypothetical protein